MKLWTWLTLEKNRKVLGWLGAGVLAVTAYFGIGKSDEKSVLPSSAVTITSPAAAVNANSQTAIAGEKGVAVNASGNARVNIKQ